MFLISEKAINVYCGCLPKILQFKWSNNLKFSHIVIRIKTTVQTLRARKILFIFKVTVHIQKKFHSIKKLKMFMVWKNFTLHFRTIIFWSCGFKRNRPNRYFLQIWKMFLKDFTFWTIYFDWFLKIECFQLWKPNIQVDHFFIEIRLSKCDAFDSQKLFLKLEKSVKAICSKTYRYSPVILNSIRYRNDSFFLSDSISIHSFRFGRIL